MPELIEFPTEVAGQNAYAYFYPPSNPLYQPNQDEKPPLLLKSHGISSFQLSVKIYIFLLYQFYVLINILGGPTSETRGILNLSIQYWTSRGWAFVDVNYGGSTGMCNLRILYIYIDMFAELFIFWLDWLAQFAVNGSMACQWNITIVFLRSLSSAQQQIKKIKEQKM